MKPLVVFDLETTGLRRDGQDWIIQFAAIKVDTQTNKIIDKLNLFIQPEGAYVMNIAAYLTHRIHPDFLKDKPYFREVAQQIYDFMSGCDLLTYNGTWFDLPFLMSEFKKVGISFDQRDFTCYDSFKIEARHNSNKLSECFKRYCGRTMEEAGLQAHDGFSDVKATYAIFRHQKENGPVDPEEILTPDEYFEWGEYEGKKVICFNTGKYKNCPIDIIKIVDPRYLEWMATVDLHPVSHEIIMNALNSINNEKN